MEGEKATAAKINAGTILIREGVLLPKSLPVESEPYSKGWRLVKGLRGSEMDRRLFEAGWNLSYLAEGELGAVAFGSDLEKTTRRAIKKVIAAMKSKQLNCVEVTQVAAKRFLGLPHVTVLAHPRQIQDSKFLFHLKRVAEWDRASLAAISG